MINNDERVLLGACVFGVDDGKVVDKKVYLGIQLSLNDVLDNAVNANVLHVTDLEAFEETYNELNAVGVVLFPQINDYVFLTADDVVLPWSGNDRDSALLEGFLANYKNCAIAYTYANVSKKCFDAGDHLVYLNNSAQTKKTRSR